MAARKSRKGPPPSLKWLVLVDSERTDHFAARAVLGVEGSGPDLRNTVIAVVIESSGPAAGGSGGRTTDGPGRCVLQWWWQLDRRC